ncbi:hypothetical protein NDU88_008216 [Pleurodeles waltl]|uniref:Uncharacterized protein n=1 Tax=Pleurodeles waltl TaxID=8319 RepID=A0AAV7PPR3_PLEWA|nr:hypothetical protein NDU88_008216 [Pleurodeles waltl]
MRRAGLKPQREHHSPSAASSIASLHRRRRGPEMQSGLGAQNSRNSSAERQTACGLLGHAEPQSRACGAPGPESCHGRDQGRHRP